MPAALKQIIPLDLQFLGNRGAIAAYLIPHTGGAALVECGPGSTLETLKSGLADHGYKTTDITDVLLTHIHLDHAGAAGSLARAGARIHVHEVGAPHLLDPEKLLSSAERIYGDQMERLWGEFLAVPADKIEVLRDGQTIEIGNLSFQCFDTPGHAYHHMVYRFEDLLFTGDIGGVRLQSTRHIRLPMPPPEFHLEKWRQSVQRLVSESQGVRRIAPTHFGIFDDPEWHLAALQQLVDDVGRWIEKTMQNDPTLETLDAEFTAWTRTRTAQDGLSEATVAAYEAANPSWMSPLGIQRYWKKYHQNG